MSRLGDVSGSIKPLGRNCTNYRGRNSFRRKLIVFIIKLSPESPFWWDIIPSQPPLIVLKLVSVGEGFNCLLVRTEQRLLESFQIPVTNGERA